jgi:hypothetical protein
VRAAEVLHQAHRRARALGHRAKPNQPERGAECRLDYVRAEPSARGRALHESAASWPPNQPEAGSARQAPAAPASRTHPQPQIGPSVAGDRALATAAALRQSRPGGGPG